MARGMGSTAGVVAWKTVEFEVGRDILLNTKGIDRRLLQKGSRANGPGRAAVPQVPRCYRVVSEL